MTKPVNAKTKAQIIWEVTEQRLCFRYVDSEIALLLKLSNLVGIPDDRFSHSYTVCAVNGKGLICLCGCAAVLRLCNRSIF